MSTISVIGKQTEEPVDKIIFDADDEDCVAVLELKRDCMVRIKDTFGDYADVNFNNLCLAIDKAKELGWGTTPPSEDQ
jgi:hypothetical protein